MRHLTIIALLLSTAIGKAQSADSFDEFRRSVFNDFAETRETIFRNFDSFRDSVNARYADFLRSAWSSHTPLAPIPKPREEAPIEPVIYDDSQDIPPVVIDSRPLPQPQPEPSPRPVKPIHENTAPSRILTFPFYGLDISLRAPANSSGISFSTSDDRSIAQAWTQLSDGRLDNTLADLLDIRGRNQLCDWAFLQLIDRFAESYADRSLRPLLTAWLLCQAGYQIRLASDSNTLSLLFASRHTIFDRSYYILDGTKYYPLHPSSGNLRICNARFDGETPLSLLITGEQNLGMQMTSPRTITSLAYPAMSADVAVNSHLINFYDSYPSSSIGSNPLTRWAICANTPFASETARPLYETLRKHLAGCTTEEALSRLLNWVQTGFKYELDNTIWGHDRAFFAEETLYYPACDCEDRAILFSRLVRDILGLPVALVYYPNHLATAVALPEPATGVTVNIDGHPFLICDPTYIGASIGCQMPGLDISQVRTLLL